MRAVHVVVAVVVVGGGGGGVVALGKPSVDVIPI